MGRDGGLEICTSPALRGANPAIEGPADFPPRRPWMFHGGNGP